MTRYHVEHAGELRIAAPPGKGTWWRWRHQVLLRCPRCGTVAALEHTIDRNGWVEPSVQCQVCEFHEYVVLEGWEP